MEWRAKVKIQEEETIVTVHKDQYSHCRWGSHLSVSFLAAKEKT